MAERDRLQFGKPLAAAGAASEDRQLVADEPATTIGQDGRPADQSRTVLLAAAGGEPFDAAAVREHGVPDRGAARARRIGRDGEGNRAKEGGDG